MIKTTFFQSNLEIAYNLLGLIELNEVKAIRNGQTIFPKITNTDGIEWHFISLRQNIGSGNSPTAQMQ